MKRRYLALTCMFVGSVATFIGLILTLLSAWLVWRQIDATGDQVNATRRDAMRDFFHSMNYFASISIAVALCGMALVLGARIALARKRKD